MPPRRNEQETLAREYPLTYRASYDASNNVEYEGWSLKVTKGQDGPQIECRKSFSAKCDYDGRFINVFGQALIMVALTGWKWKKESGKTDVRLSMNGPCPMDFDDLATFGRVAEHARKILVNLNLKQITFGELMTTLQDYYNHQPDHSWPVMVGKAGMVKGMEQFVIYPKVAGAISQMNELFEEIGNVEVKQEEVGPVIAAALEYKS